MSAISRSTISRPSSDLIAAPSAWLLVSSSVSVRIFSASKKKSCEISSGTSSSTCCAQLSEYQASYTPSLNTLRISRTFPSRTCHDRLTSKYASCSSATV